MKSKTESLQLDEETILSTISEHTGTDVIRRASWLRNIRYNEKHFDFRQTLSKDLEERFRGRKALVLGAGPAFKRLGTRDLEKIVTSSPTVVIACDGAFPTLASQGITPDIIVSVDSHPVVNNFYRRTFESFKMIGRPPTVLLSTTIHKDVVESCLRAGCEIRWFQSNAFRQLGMPKFHREGLCAVDSGGNVGTTSFVITSMILKCSPIGLMGLEFSWSDETPLCDTQYFDQIMKIVGLDTENAKKMFKIVHNNRDGKDYVADPVYFSYAVRFREIWEQLLPKEVKANTFNLTKEGILSARGLRTISAEDFIRL